MKYILFALISVFTLNIMAVNKANSCLGKITDNYSVDSKSFKINTDSVNTGADHSDHMARSVAIIKSLAGRHGCSPNKELNFSRSSFGKSKSYCRRISTSREHSMSCYIETNLGFFFVMEDLQTNAFVIFSRWD